MEEVTGRIQNTEYRIQNIEYKREAIDHLIGILAHQLISTLAFYPKKIFTV